MGVGCSLLSFLVGMRNDDGENMERGEINLLSLSRSRGWARRYI